MTDITVTNRGSVFAPSRAWLAEKHGTDLPKHVTYDFTTFTHANFTTDKMIPSGTILGVITATGKYGPYDSSAADGRQTAARIEMNWVPIPEDKTKVITGAALEHCGVRVPALPLKTGPGSLDAKARTDLKHVVFYG